MDQEPVKTATKRRLARLLWGALAVLLLAGAIYGGLKYLQGKEGDFIHFYEAARAVNEGRDIYASGRGGYIYPPLVAVALSPLCRAPMNIAGFVWCIVIAVATFGALRFAAPAFWRRLGSPGSAAIPPAGALFALAIMFDKTLSQLRLGQTDALVLFAIAVGFAFLGRRPWVAGITLGLAANVKYQTLIFLPYLLIRRRWKESMGMVGGMVAGGLLPALVLGWDTNLGYLKTAFAGLLRMAGIASEAAAAANIYPIDWPRSVSIPSALARWLGEDNPAGVMAGTLIVAAMCGLTFWAIALRSGQSVLLRRGWPIDDREPGPMRMTAMEWCGMVVAFLAFSPQTTARHIFLAILVMVPVGVILLSPRGGMTSRMPLIVGTILLFLGLVFPPDRAQFYTALTTWRGIAGPSICLIVAYFTLVFVTLRPPGSNQPPPS